MWWVTTQKNGASALGLQRVLGLKSYETAWAWLRYLSQADTHLKGIYRLLSSASVFRLCYLDYAHTKGAGDR